MDNTYTQLIYNSSVNIINTYTNDTCRNMKIEYFTIQIDGLDKNRT